MGEYLSKPDTTKTTEFGENQRVILANNDSHLGTLCRNWNAGMASDNGGCSYSLH